VVFLNIVKGYLIVRSKLSLPNFFFKFKINFLMFTLSKDKFFLYFFSIIRDLRKIFVGLDQMKLLCLSI